MEAEQFCSVVKHIFMTFYKQLSFKDDLILAWNWSQIKLIIPHFMWKQFIDIPNNLCPLSFKCSMSIGKFIARERKTFPCESSFPWINQRLHFSWLSNLQHQHFEFDPNCQKLLCKSYAFSEHFSHLDWIEVTFESYCNKILVLEYQHCHSIAHLFAVR